MMHFLNIRIVCFINKRRFSLNAPCMHAPQLCFLGMSPHRTIGCVSLIVTLMERNALCKQPKSFNDPEMPSGSGPLAKANIYIHDVGFSGC